MKDEARSGRMNMRVLSVLLVIVLAATGEAEELGKALCHDGNAAEYSIGHMLSAPLHGSAQDYWMVGGIAAVVAASSALDRTVRNEMPHNENGWRKTVDDIGHAYQGPLVVFGTAGSLYAAGLIADEPSLRRTGAEVVEAYCIAGAGTQAMKHLVGRKRPYNEEGPFTFTGPSLKNSNLSFPSGDATVAFALSAVLAAEAKSVPVTIIAYGLAGMTAYQRLNRDQHWFSDVLGAAVWGSAVGMGVVHWNRKYEATKGVSLNASTNEIGLSLSL
jgi:hypothetical protein